MVTLIEEAVVLVPSDRLKETVGGVPPPPTGTSAACAPPTPVVSFFDVFVVSWPVFLSVLVEGFADCADAVAV
jgi:hypothetical protein